MNTDLASFSDQLIAVVVGASGGVGGALIKQLLGNSRVKRVYGLSRQYQNGFSEHSHYTHCVVDITDESSLKHAVDQLPDNLDIVVIASGVLHSDQGLKPEKGFTQLQVQNLQTVFMVNTIAPALCARFLLPKMNRQSKNVFAALSARVGSIGDNRLGGWYSYRASKAALNMLIKTLSIELKRRQPKTVIVGLHPGTVDTGLSKPFQRNVKPEALFTPEFSAVSLLNVVENLTPNDSGYCFAWDGARVPE